MNIFDIINEPEEIADYAKEMHSRREMHKLNLFLHSFEKNFYICLHGRNYQKQTVKWRDTFLESVFIQTKKDKKFENESYMRLILSFVNATLINPTIQKIGRF